MGIKGWEVSLFLVVMGFNKYYHCNIRLQSHQNFNKHYSFFLSYETVGEKNKKLSLENFLCIFLQMKTFVKKVHLWKVLTYLKKKKILLYTCSHNYAEINGKFKKSQCKTKEGKYCTLAKNLFHHKIHCFPSSDHRSHFHLELAEAMKGSTCLAEGPQGH